VDSENAKMVSLIETTGYQPKSEEMMLETANSFFECVNTRRTVRDFSDKPCPDAVINRCLEAASTAPSGANLQPWHFAVVKDPDIKNKIRIAAEKEEQAFYGGRAPKEWRDALVPFGTNEQKPFLEIASHLIVVFSRSYEAQEDGSIKKHYYPVESTGLATGILIPALHQSGLVTLTHTPSPMKFLSNILGRPAGDRPFLLLVVGYPKDDATIPDITRKNLDEIASFH